MRTIYRMNVNRVRALAFEKGYTIHGLCEAAGIGHTNVRRWETAGVHPQTIRRIANVLEVSPGAIAEQER